MTNDGRLRDKIAVITGGNRGIGLATAEHFVAEGARVVMFGREDSVQTEATRLGNRAFGVRGDVTEPDDLRRLFATVRERFGRVDVLHVNAGVSRSAAIGETTDAFFDLLFAVNVKGAFFTLQHALPLLRPGASVVVTTSNTHAIGYPALSVYAGTKGALRAMVRSWAAELVGRGIRVNAVSPGPIATELLTRELPAASKQAFYEGVASLVPMKRMGQADEIAKAVLFLASDESAFMTGAELGVDGGTTEM